MFHSIQFAGTHVILDLYGVCPTLLANESRLDEIMRAAVLKSGATILHSHFHHFGGDYGVTGVVVLAESHASIHTWPEKNYASIDIYMCGNCDPRIASGYLQSAMFAEYHTEQILYRGTECE